MTVTSDYKVNLLYYIAFNSSLGSIAWGYKLTIFNSLRVFLQTNVFPDASDEAIATIASILTVGAAFGAYFSGKLVSTYGRLKTLLLADILGIVGAICGTFHSLPMIFLGRTIAGFTIGINSAIISLYNVEMSPLQLKGRMGAVSQAMLALGVLLGYSAELFLPDIDEGKDSQIWRLLMGVPLIFHGARAFIFLRILHFETPFFLVLKGRLSEAKLVLEQIYTGNIELHLQKVIKDKEAVTSGGDLKIMDLFSKKYKNSTLMALLLTSGVQACGFCPIFMFCNMFIYESANRDPTTIAYFSNILGLTSFTFTVVTALIVEKTGRRPLMIKGTAALFLCEFLYVAIGFISGPDDPLLKYIFTIFWPAAYRLSAGTISFVYNSEVLPSVGVSFSLLINWIMAFVIVQTFLPLVKMIRLEGIMFLWSLFLLASTILYNKYLIESKGKTKAELLSLYNEEEKEDGLWNSNVEMSRIYLIKK